MIFKSIRGAGLAMLLALPMAVAAQGLPGAAVHPDPDSGAAAKPANSESRKGDMAERCKANPQRCEEMKARMKARHEQCQADPQKCRQDRKARFEEHCKRNPQRCEEMKAKMQERRAQCKSDPTRCGTGKMGRPEAE